MKRRNLIKTAGGIGAIGILGTAGVSANATEIADRDDLEQIEDDLEGDFVLVDDIDLSGEDWDPIDDFAGTLDGDGHTIQHMTIDDGAGSGGFFDSGDGMEVKNLRFEDAYCPPLGDWFHGIVAGEAEGTFTNIEIVDSTVDHDDWYGGGLIGFTYEGVEISDITLINVTVESDGYSEHSGGLTSWLSGDASNIYAENVDVSGPEWTGALVGYCNGNLTNCGVVDSEVSGDSKVGGIAGDILSDNELKNFYFRGNVNGGDEVGGICGDMGDISMSTGYVAAEVDGDDDVGIIAGTAGDVDSEYVYYDEDISSLSSDLATGLTTDEMTGEDAAENMEGFDFE